MAASGQPPSPMSQDESHLLPTCKVGQARGRDPEGLVGAARVTPARPQAGRLFDHGGTVFFSVFMALWAVLLLEYWKRKSATLAYRWGCSDYEDIEVGRPPALGHRPPARPPARPPLSARSSPGAAEAPVCRLGSHDSPEPSHGCGGALFPQEEPRAPRAGRGCAGADDGERPAAAPPPGPSS